MKSGCRFSSPLSPPEGRPRTGTQPRNHFASPTGNPGDPGVPRRDDWRLDRPQDRLSSSSTKLSVFLVEPQVDEQGGGQALVGAAQSLSDLRVIIL